MIFDIDSNGHGMEDQRADFEEQNAAGRNGENGDEERDYEDVSIPVLHADYDDPGVIVVKSIDDEGHEVDLNHPDASERLAHFWNLGESITGDDLAKISHRVSTTERYRNIALTREDFFTICRPYEDPGKETMP